MGGLMSLYALFTYNSVFSGALCLSPSLWVAPQKLYALVEKSPLDPVTDIYISCGEMEMQSQGERIQPFFQMVSLLQNRKICVTSRIAPRGKHCEASWERELPLAVPALLYRCQR
jgi:predicted alpha/beta superfamily hydrolase